MDPVPVQGDDQCSIAPICTPSIRWGDFACRRWDRDAGADLVTFEGGSLHFFRRYRSRAPCYAKSTPALAYYL